MGFLCRRKKHSTIATANASFSKEKEGGENNSGENSSGSPVIDLNGVDAQVAAGDRRSSKMDCSNGLGNEDVVVNSEEMVNGDVKNTGKSVEADDRKDSNPLNSSQKTKMYSKSNLSKVPHHPPNLNDNKNPGYSKLSSFASRRKSPPIFDYELDENSEAGISAAALKKALEQAQKTITIVKMIKEKGKEGLKGGSKSKANSSLDVKDDKQTVDENFGEIFNEFVQQEDDAENISILGDDFVDVNKSAGFCDAEKTNESDENRDGFEFREAGFEESIDEDDDAYSNDKETFIGSKLHIALESLSSDSSKTAIEIHNAAKIDTQSLRDIEQTSTHEPQECAENANNMTSNNETEYFDEIDKSSVENNTKVRTKQEKFTEKNEQKFDTNDMQQRIEAIKKGREREKERKAVERAIREARERAFVEAQERAAIEAKLKAERIAVERATKEARERALEKSISQRENGLKQSFSSSDMDKVDRDCSESAQRRKARMERHQRIMERAAKALAEKNMRDLLVQREQAERNRLSQYLDAEIKRWATGKEGNIRALLSTLQYILGRDSGCWKTISLTEIVTNVAVKKAYRQATLYLHPDKLQQRGANVRQKYICEKVFDLLKAAWNRFNSEGR